MKHFILNENHAYLSQSFRVARGDLTIVNEALIAVTVDIISRTQNYIDDNQVCCDRGSRICPHGTIRLTRRILMQFEYFSKHCHEN